MRRKTREICIGGVTIGGDNPIAVQSMTNTRTEDVSATVAQIHALEEAGCDIIRCAVPTPEAAEALREIRRQIRIPLVADIHFDYRLAIASIEAGADKIRINPGNIGSEDRVRAVVEAARARQIPIRVGVNSGSLEKEILERDGRVTARGLADSALAQVRRIEALDYQNLVISIKSSDVPTAVEAHEILSAQTDYPLHVGITEAGTVYRGIIKSAVGLGAILSRGIGDTVRVSLTGDPVEEVRAARRILASLNLISAGPEIVSCPTCGRTEIDLIGLSEQVEKLLSGYDLPIKVAVMGCVVNGPGEAREADLGIAGGRGEGLLFRRGEIIRKLPEEELLPALREELDRLSGRQRGTAR
ncbi:MAG: flavodoxin-dependent (E)-4-hydroxy-3-methylbut-2-enyl-diphosphate synthase [Lachnospiraceae bacterium]|nr:flavodoxin-dependent (E)-4-hydroxy-3-methylbut-2-enyl-diphosphate synthase [Lachnospiraceae bacterium]